MQSQKDGYNHLYLFDINGKELKQLTKGQWVVEEMLGFNKKDKSIIIVSNEKNAIQHNLYAVDTNTGKRTLLDNGRGSHHGVLSESGSWLYDKYTEPDVPRNIDAIHVASGSPASSTRLLTAKDPWEGYQQPIFESGRIKAADGKTDLFYRMVKPHDFDATKKYPMIVNYYGGCSPTSRNFESRYPHHAYAAQGYVVYVVEPSGAAGFGQEFAARHVNTAGEGPAQDIIEGTKKFCEEHSFVDAKKIGCIGASYGGFMTQYLQTKTDIFAAAISHAGISDHTSYWGEGYWGYNYSEVSMANSYPWANKELYVDRSPLFNADKIHTPLLFLHGTADTNVPVGESIQMYTALKLLQRPTALVVVEGENHHILDYEKRVKWQNTIFAWFAKYLKDDASWWNSMYDKVPE
jgi:dipeptidyl aminopeptidase/acylaminoacyl peptidase